VKNRYEKFRGIGSYSRHFRRIIYSEVEQLQTAVAIGLETVKRSDRIRNIAKPVKRNKGKSKMKPDDSTGFDSVD